MVTNFGPRGSHISLVDVSQNSVERIQMGKVHAFSTYSPGLEAFYEHISG